MHVKNMLIIFIVLQQLEFNTSLGLHEKYKNQLLILFYYSKKTVKKCHRSNLLKIRI